MKKNLLVYVILCLIMASCNNKRTDTVSGENSPTETNAYPTEEDSLFGEVKEIGFALFHEGMSKQDVDEAINKLRENDGPWVSVCGLQFVVNWDATEFKDGNLSFIQFVAEAPETFYLRTYPTRSMICFHSDSNIRTWSGMEKRKDFIESCLHLSFGGSTQDPNTLGTISKSGELSYRVLFEEEFVDKRKNIEADGNCDDKSYDVDVYSVKYYVNLFALNNLPERSDGI